MDQPKALHGSTAPAPVGSWPQLFTNGKYDLLSGFLVFLIALPLCLAISLASGYPAMAGVMTAIVGGFFGATISNSELTIKGPAAGLIVIVLGCVIDFGGALDAAPEAKRHAYQAALAVSVCAALIQVSMALLRAGLLSEFVPLAAVHGMLSAVGLIIMIKQFPVVTGYDGPKLPSEPLQILTEIPHAALAAMLIYTGFRLAHPNELFHAYRVGIEQLAIFLVTIIGVLAIDLLVGVAMGSGLKFLFVLYNGAPFVHSFVHRLKLTTKKRCAGWWFTIRLSFATGCRFVARYYTPSKSSENMSRSTFTTRHSSITP
jgi:MFS superfamily sulfate permease-like transporter